MTGIVKKKTDRGFGFISMEGQEKDLFFHSSALVNITFDALAEGTTVTFEVKDGGDGRQSAVNVQVADASAPVAESEAVEMTAEEAPKEEASPVEETAEDETAQPAGESPSTDESSKTE